VKIVTTQQFNCCVVTICHHTTH